MSKSSFALKLAVCAILGSGAYVAGAVTGSEVFGQRHVRMDLPSADETARVMRLRAEARELRGKLEARRREAEELEGRLGEALGVAERWREQTARLKAESYRSAELRGEALDELSRVRAEAASAEAAAREARAEAEKARGELAEVRERLERSRERKAESDELVARLRRGLAESRRETRAARSAFALRGVRLDRLDHMSASGLAGEGDCEGLPDFAYEGEPHGPRPGAGLSELDQPDASQRKRLARGMFAYECGDYEAAFAAWMPLAKVGYSRAKFHVGALFMEGRGVRRSEALAFLWLEAAASDGVEAAGAMLARMRGDRQDASALRDLEDLREGDGT